MYSEELRPLKRPRLGVPDVYPQENRQKEDEMTDYNVQKGFSNKPSLSRECDSALGEIDAFVKGRPKDESPMVMQLKTIMKQKNRAAWVQESQKKKMALSKEMFLPVTLMSQKKQEALSSWFQDLAGNKSLQALSRSKIPLLMKKEEIFDLLCEHSVPMSRATWFIKMTAAHNSMLNETRVRKKQAPDPAQEWTLAVYAYLHDIASKLFRVDRDTPGDRDRDPLGEGDSTSLMARWQYIVRLSQWMYNKGLLDHHDFLKSLVEFLESTTLRQHHLTDDPLRLLLPLVVQFLPDITGCLSLARPLAKVCVKRFTSLHNSGEKTSSNLRRCWESDPDAVSKMLEAVEVGEAEVPSSPAHSVSALQRSSRRSQSAKQEDMDTMPPPTIPSLLGKPQEDSGEGVSKETLSSGNVTRRQSEATTETEDKCKVDTTVSSDASGTEPADSASKPAPPKPVTPAPTPEPDLSSYSWCSSHRSLLLTLSYIIQTVAVKCTSALVALPSKQSLPSSLQGKTGTKTFKPLEVLPVALPDLPPLQDANREKVKALLRTVEEEVLSRSKAVESGWSFVDQQSPSEGGNVKCVLEVLEVLDNQLFTKSGAVSPVTALMRRLRVIMANPQAQVKDSQFVMLLCRWAVTPHREGQHRPLVAAQLIKQRQNTVLKKPYHEGPVTSDDDSMECCGGGADDSTRDDRATPTYPFQEVLFKFLECHPPPWRGTHRHATGESPFFLLMILFGELIRLGVFSYSAYLSTLIARADLVTPIMSRLMSGADSIAEDESEAELTKPTLTISIPYVRRVKPSDLSSGSSLAKDGPAPEVKTEAPLTSPTASTFVIATGSTRAPVGDTPSSAVSSLATPDLLHQRHNQLQKLLNQHSPDPGPFSPFDSPTLGNSPNHEFHGLSPTSLTTPASSTERGRIKVAGFPVSPAVKTKNSHHTIFAAYMPISSSVLSQSIVNERMVALCGVSKGKSLVQELQSSLEQRFLEIYYPFSAQNTFISIQWAYKEHWQRFSKLPLFYKRAIASRLESILRSALPDQYPSTSQLCLMADILEQAGDFQGLVSLLVDLVAMGKKMELSGDKTAGEDWLDPAHKSLPQHLCVLVSSLLQRHMACLQLSEHNTCVVFESLCLVLRDSTSPALTHSQRAVFDLLLRLYHSCQYVRNTYESSLTTLLLSKIKEPHLNTSVRPVATTDITWIRTTLVNQLIQPSLCDVGQLGYTLNLSPKANGFTLVCEALSLVCVPPAPHLYSPLTFGKICDLAQLVAELACLCDSVPPELLGALVAISLPFDASYGFQQLVLETRVHVHNVTSPYMKNLLIFIALLVGLNTVPLMDIISRILRPLVRSYLSQATSNPATTAQSNMLLNLFILLVLLLLVDPEDLPKNLSVSPIVDSIVDNLPTVVLHQLRTKRRELGLNILFSVLKDLLKVAQPSLQKDMTVGGGGRAGMQIHVQATPTSINEVRAALEALASQRWLGEMCHREEGKMLEKERLGEASIMPLQTRYLLMLLCPIQGASAQKLSGLEQVDLVKDTQVGIRYILQNLDLWTLRASLLHISMLIKQTPHSSRSSVVDSLASSVIQVFEDSCSEEWVGQHMETDQGDGAHSPPIWLVTPLISKLPAIVLGRVLKNAGTVLGRGQWWSLEKSLEKKRTTRQTSTTPGKYGLQWQQPFLELVLACMKAQRTIHEELLAPLQKQLHNFLSAFEKEGLPSDELAKSTLQAALKLRLSLIGSMLLSLRDSEQHCTDWALLLLQLLVSGAVDRQTDNSDSDLFTSTLDMVSTLLSWMNSDFLLVPMVTGDEGKKTTVSIIRKLKSDLVTSKSTCLPEIRQLFPLSPKMLEVTTVRPPAWVQHGLPEKIRGFKIQDTRDISPWDVIEGIKNFGPLNLSWFGAVRMERRVPKYEVQTKLIQCHAHKKNAVGHSFVQFADPAEIEAANTKKDIPEKTAIQTPTDVPLGSNVTESQPHPPDTTVPPIQRSVSTTTPHPTPPRPIQMPHYPAPGGGYSTVEVRQPYQPHPSMPTGQPSYPGQPVMVGGTPATYPGQGQVQRLPLWARTAPSMASRPPGSVAMGYPGQRTVVTPEMRMIEQQRRYEIQQQQQQHEMRMRQQQQQQQQRMLMMQQPSAVPGQFRMPATPPNPGMMAYRPSHPRMMNSAMRMGGMPGGSPGMGGMQSAHMQPRQVMRPQGGHPGMAPPPGGGAYSQAGAQYQGAPHYRQPGYYQ